MTTYVLIHGAGDVAWYWHLLEAELRARGHDVVAPDLPGDDDSLELNDYADAVVASVGDRRDLVVVAQSFGGFTAPLVAVRLPVDALVFVAGMVPSPGEAPRDWWDRTGYRQAVEEQAARDGGMTGNEDPYVCFYHDVPREIAAEAMSKERAHPSKASMASPWPLDALPDVPTVCWTSAAGPANPRATPPAPPSREAPWASTSPRKCSSAPASAPPKR